MEAQMTFRLVPAAALLLAACAQDPGVVQATPMAVPVDLAAAAREAETVVDSFHAALARGDTAAALALLAEDALIFESGGVERSKAEYAGHHLGSDAAFSQAVPGKVAARTARAVGDLAWIASERRVAGTFRGKAIDRQMTETMVLRRDVGSWQIVHIHWS